MKLGWHGVKLLPLYQACLADIPEGRQEAGWGDMRGPPHPHLPAQPGGPQGLAQPSTHPPTQPSSPPRPAPPPLPTSPVDALAQQVIMEA